MRIAGLGNRDLESGPRRIGKWTFPPREVSRHASSALPLAFLLAVHDCTDDRPYKNIWML